MDEILSIEEAFGDLKDPHSRTPEHDLTEMLVVALCAILAGADSWSGIEIWGASQAGLAAPPCSTAQRHPFARYLPAGIRGSQPETV
ncbi:transposase family protein [Paraburkholderia sp. BL10I2N1]|uniref:transposase family protein n=1 Tax=Paraburkholderia sp. BL10I2N1 TaxID=1938796 RepID=UPI001FB85E03|nr:transposase family protein [Paraburkholderia sp. BL10I2N1]